MKKTHLALALLAISSLATPALADQTSGYLRSADGQIVRSGSDLCWHTGSWVPADAVAGCDPVVVSPVVDPVAPPARVVEPSTPVVRAPQWAASRATVHFEFDRATLTPAAKATIDSLAAEAYANGSKPGLVQITGHTDRIGTEAYNHGLAARRARAVADRFAEKGVGSGALRLLEEGESQPVTKGCKAGKGLIACLAPDRRAEVIVEIETMVDPATGERR